MKSKTATDEEALNNKRSLRALRNLAMYGRKSGDPLLGLVLKCLTNLYLGDWTELPDGVHRRRIWSWWGTHYSQTERSYSEEPWSEKIDGRGSATNALINRFILSVFTGDHLAIRRIEEAVKRANRRMMEVGIHDIQQPRSPQILELIRTTAGATIPIEASKIQEAFVDMGGAQISERTARRHRAFLGVKAAKRGAPRGPRKRKK